MKLRALLIILVIFTGCGYDQERKERRMNRSVPSYSPEDICPLLPGMNVPDTDFYTWETKKVSLEDIYSKSPVVLIFYRGGW